MENNIELSDSEITIVEALVGAPMSKWVCTDRKTEWDVKSSKTKEYSSILKDLVIINAKEGYEVELKEVRGVIIDIEEKKVVLQRKHFPIHVQDDLVGKERDLDPKVDVPSNYDEIRDNFVNVLNEVKDSTGISEEMVVELTDLASKYINGYNLKAHQSIEEIEESLKTSYKIFEDIGKKIAEIARNKKSVYSDAARFVLIPLLMDLSHMAAYKFNKDNTFKYEKCCTEGSVNVPNIINIEKELPFLIESLEKESGSKDPMIDITFPWYYRRLLNCRNRSQAREVTDNFLTKVSNNPTIISLVFVFSIRVFNENVLFRLRQNETRTYYPIFEGYSFTLFKYGKVRALATHRKFIAFDKDIVVATNNSVVREGCRDDLIRQGKSDEEIEEILPSFEDIPMRDGDSVKFMHISDNFIMGSRTILDGLSSYKFEQNFRSRSGSKILDLYTDLSEYSLTPEYAESYLQNGKTGTSEALYVASSDGDFKIHSKAYEIRHKMMTRNITINDDYTGCLLSNFMIGYFKSSTKGLSEEEKKEESRRRKEIFLNEFPIITPVSSRVTLKNVGVVKDLKPLDKKDYKFIDNYQFRVAVIYTTMLYYCHERRRHLLINSMKNLLIETESLIKNIDEKNSRLFKFSKRAETLSALRESNALTGNKYSASYSESCRLLVLKENPYSLGKLIHANRNAMSTQL